MQGDPNSGVVAMAARPPVEPEAQPAQQTQEGQKTQETQATKTRRLPPYHVLLENDDHHSFEFVMSVLHKALGYDEPKCFELTMLAHTSGRAVVWTGSKEVAELKMEQMLSFHEIKADGQKLGPLGVCIEPAPG